MTKSSKVPFSVTSAGATSVTRYVGGTTTGAPSGATFVTGDWAISQDGHLWVCTTGGSPGTWTDAGGAGGPVSTVAGRTGAVTLTAADIGAGTFPAGTFIFPSDLRAVNSFLAIASGAGYTQVKVGDATHTGSVNFYAANDNRQGWIGFASTTGTTDTGTLNYTAATHAFAGQVTISNGTQFAASGTTGPISVAYNGATADNNNYGIVGVTAPVGVNTAYYSMTVAGTAIAGMGMDGTNTLRIGTINSGKTMSANSVKIDSSGNVTTVGNVIAAAHSATGLTGAVAASRYVGGTASGAPSSGTFATGDFVVAQNGHIWVCTAGASPGTWVDAGSYGAGGGGASLSVANTWTASQTFQTSDGSQPLFVKARITANGGQSGPLATFAAADGTTYLTIDASANLTSVGTGKFKTGIIGVGGSTYGSLLFEKYTSATSGATTRDSSTTSFRTAYWNGSVSVDEDLILQANRASTTAADVDLTLNTGRFKAPAFVATGLTGSTASGRWVGTTVTGPPTTGAHLLGDFVNSQDGNFYTCTAAGTPGSWMVSTGSGAAGPAGPQGGTELAAVEVSAGYTVTVKDGTTYTDIPGGSFTIPAGQAFDLEMMAYLTVRLDTGASIGDARVDLRVVDSAVTQVYASDSHRFYWLTVVTAGTQAWNNRLMFCKKRFAAQASPLTLKLQTMCTANLSSTVTFTATNALAQPLQMIATAR